MKYPWLKMILAIVLAAALLVPIFFLLENASVKAARDEITRRNYNRLEGFCQVMENLMAERDRLEAAYLGELETDFRLETAALKEYAEGDRYTGPETLENGCVVRIRDGEAVYPEGWSAETLPLPEDFREKEFSFFPIRTTGSRWTDTGMYCRITADDWAVRLIRRKDVRTYVSSFLDIPSVIRTMESIYSGHLILFDKDGRLEEDEEDDFFPEDATVRSMGLNLTADPPHSQTWVNNGEAWRYVYRWFPSGRVWAVFFYREEGVRGFTAGSCTVVLSGLALLAAAMITWHIAQQRMVRDKILTQEQYQRYLPQRLRRLSALFCLVSTAVLFLISLHYIQLAALRTESMAAADALHAVEDRSGEEAGRQETMKNRELGAMLELARKAADRMSRQQSLQRRDYLERLCGAMGCEYAMLYDTDGNEILSSRDYVDFTLGSTEEDEMYPFRRLLQGVETWTAAPARDRITGRELQKIGVRMAVPGSNRYGALILTLDPEILTKEDVLFDGSALIRMITPSDAICFSVNRETGVISQASDAGMNGAQAANYGISEALMRDNDTCGLTSGGRNWYGASRVIGQEVWFYCVQGNVLQEGILGFAAQGAAASLVFLGLLLTVLLWGYTRKNYDHYSTIGQEVVRHQTVEIVAPDGQINRTMEQAMRWGSSGYRWRNMTPGGKARRVFLAGLLVTVLTALVLLVTSGELGSSIIGFILSGHWDRGMNLFALTAAMMLAGGALMVVLVLKLAVQLICLSVGTKGETVLRLLLNLTQYIVLFMVLFYGFNFFGLDTSGLLGVMAFLSLAVSLGARDIVADILAGITIVFEGEYEVGDIVEIGGCRGKVMEIGARSTKLMVMGDNVRIINNRDVKNVLNMTRYNSWYAMELNISSECPVEKLEEILQRELPAIGRRAKKIISGPVYKGVEAVGKGSFRIKILAECREDHYRRVQRFLNREVQLLVMREEIPMA